MGNPNAALVNKEMWDHFTPEEMEIIAAHVYAYQTLPKTQTEHAQELNRAWPIYDRFMTALKTLQMLFDAHPGDNLNFTIAWYDIARSQVDSGQQRIDPRESAKSKEIYQNLLNWNEKELQKYADGFGGSMNKTFGFNRLDPKDVAPLQLERKTISSYSIDELKKLFDKNKPLPKVVDPLANDPVLKKPEVAEQLVPVVEKKRAGRPKKLKPVDNA